jgi:hypothetical protein
MLFDMQIWVVLPLLIVAGYLLYLAGAFRGRHQSASGESYARTPGHGDGGYFYTSGDSGGSSDRSGDCGDGGGDAGGGCGDGGGGGGDGGGGGGGGD